MRTTIATYIIVRERGKKAAEMVVVLAVASRRKSHP